MTDNYPTSALIRPRPSHKQTQMPWQKPSPYRKQKMKQNENIKVGSLILAAILLVIVSLLSGCHTQPIQPCVQPTIPTAPVSQLPQPKETYSISVQRDLSKWQQMLTTSVPKQ